VEWCVELRITPHVVGVPLGSSHCVHNAYMIDIIIYLTPCSYHPVRIQCVELSATLNIIPHTGWR